MSSQDQRDPWQRRQADRALERQLEYQRQKAAKLGGREGDVISAMQRSSQRVRALLETHQPVDGERFVLEVGSGAHGLSFFFGGRRLFGVDPLAVEYRSLFPAWQNRVQTIAAFGERLPFTDKSFDIVLCDNVVDHAEGPALIVKELVRVLKPGGMLYFTVNIHHPMYSIVARAHSTWNRLGLHYEIDPFADHTVHLTAPQARKLFRNLSITVLVERNNINETKVRARTMQARHLGDRLKRVFFKNALFEIVARKQDS